MEQALSLWSGAVGPGGFKPDLTDFNKTKAGTEMVLTGVVFKDMKKRPSVIDQYKDARGAGQLVSMTGDKPLWSENDALFLEDNLMRVKLVAPPEIVGSLSTGFVVAVRGLKGTGDSFNVTAYCLARFTRARPVASPMRAVGASAPERRTVVLCSGLSLGSKCEELRKARNSALDALLGKGQEKPDLVIICGGTLASKAQYSSIQEALEEADSFLAQIAAVAPVVVLPNNDEPTNACFPQMPLHQQLFKKSRGLENFKRACNPYFFDYAGTSFVGHSGQPVEDLLRCTTLSSPLAALKTCLEGRHLAPTAPDTLPLQPFSDTDPFVLHQAPDLLFSGGHERAAHEWVPSNLSDHGTQCLIVPAFHKDPVLVTVNLNNLREVEIQEFGHLPALGEDVEMAAA